MKEEKKEISKGTYKFMVWGLLIVGLIINAVCYTFLTKSLEKGELQLAGFLGVGMAIAGYAMGLATARTFKIKGVDIN